MTNVFLCLSLVHLLVCFVNTQDPRISSRVGELVGKTTTIPLDTLPYKTVHEYLGIPYAQPPLGERRFRKPETKTNLNSPFFAQNHSAICPQVGVYEEIMRLEQDEDCLYLNVYVPDQPADKPSGHAVMIWVYGGAFQEGAADLYSGLFVAAVGNVIVVTFNYRVGSFGFLSTGDENAQGNFGLYDQLLAFQWVHDYISDFGGDNQRVTIAGSSAGAACVIQHALRPNNHGLFQRIIAQSGSMSNPLLDLERAAFASTLALANHLGCSNGTKADTVSCLRSKSVEDILSGMKATGTEGSFIPAIDGDLIKTNPKYIEKLTSAEIEFFQSIDMLSGLNKYEGVGLLRLVYSDSVENMQPNYGDMKNVYVPHIMKILYHYNLKDQLLTLINAQYTDWTDPYNFRSIRLQITKLLGDKTFVVPAIEMARLHKDVSRNFMYYFTPAVSFRPVPSPSWIDGATHADEIAFVFGAIGLYIGIGVENMWEIGLAFKMTTYWTNFVKSGNPNEPVDISPIWPEYNTDTGNYLELEKSMSNDSAKIHLFAEEANFWLKVFPDLANATESRGRDSECEYHTSAAAVDTVYPVLLPFLLNIVIIFHVYNKAGFLF